MKGICDKCGEVYSITASPNKIEGYFITQELWELIIFDSIKSEDLIKHKDRVYCQRCPSCGSVTAIGQLGEFSIKQPI